MLKQIFLLLTIITSLFLLYYVSLTGLHPIESRSYTLINIWNVIFGQNHEGERYSKNDKIPIAFNRVGAANNPTIMYEYSKFPFCKAKEMEYVPQGLGEIILGERKFIHDLYNIYFDIDDEMKILCKKTLHRDDIMKLRDSITNDYFAEIYVDGIPTWYYLGEIETDGNIYIYPHLQFNFEEEATNSEKGRIIFVDIKPDEKRKLLLPDNINEIDIEFSYSTKWVVSKNTWEDRMNALFGKPSLFPDSFELHWLSVTNNLIIGGLLLTTLCIILRLVLNKDLSDIGAEDMSRERGWKLLSSQIFRKPKYILFFCSLIGAGGHLFITALFVLIFILLGFVPSWVRGDVLSSFIFLYIFCSFFGGFISGRTWKMFSHLKNYTNYNKLDLMKNDQNINQNNNNNNNNINNEEKFQMVKLVIYTEIIFLLPFVIIYYILNIIAFNINSSAYISFSYNILFIMSWCFISLPLTYFGVSFGYNYSKSYQPPCKTDNIARQIKYENIPFYGKFFGQILIAGFISFSVIYSEVAYFISSIWGLKSGAPFGMILISLILLVLIVAGMNISLSYIQLSNLDYNWWWRSIFNGGSLSIFFFIYCIYFYYDISPMYGTIQSLFFFGYMSVLSFALFLVLAFIGFGSSFGFVDYIYKSSRFD